VFYTLESYKKTPSHFFDFFGNLKKSQKLTFL
jgi:hypothetical protein